MNRDARRSAGISALGLAALAALAKLATLAALATLSSCAASRPPAPPAPAPPSPARAGDLAPLIAHLGHPAGDERGLQAIASSFGERNPGYELTWMRASRGISPASRARIAFVQRGATAATIVERDAHANSEVAVGDLLVLRPGAGVDFDDPVDLLLFWLPDVPGADVPVYVRPDWDPRITDTPGGCATETGAYRRILLTWRGEVGPYTYRGLNAHRVRITDSFTHYHPAEGGFDEFYLVQMVQPGADLLTSGRVEDIERRTIGPADARGLFRSTMLQVGDLVYLPRGLAHRGRGGVLAQVITVPGFVPGKEIGIDHHLRAINERLGLEGRDALPFHGPGDAPVVR